HTTIMRLLTHVLAAMMTALAEESPSALALLDIVPPHVPVDVPVIHFTDAQALIARDTGEALQDELDLAPAHERWLGEWAQRTHGSVSPSVTASPMAKRPFYPPPAPTRPGHSRGFDLLFRGLELVTGGQRLHRHEDYREALVARGIDPSPLAGYLEAF